MKKYFYYPLLFLIILSGCKSSAPQQKGKLLISMEKTGCMGQCPVYSLYIYENGLAELEGKKHLDKQGYYIAQLSEDELQNLIRAFEEKNFFEYQDEYISRRSDLPTTYLYFSHNGKMKKIKDYDQAPESLKELEGRVANLLDTLDWKRVKEEGINSRKMYKSVE